MTAPRTTAPTTAATTSPPATATTATAPTLTAAAAADRMRNRPRVAHHRPVDLSAAEAAATALLKALGVRLDEPGTAETPGRMARAYAEMLQPHPFDFTVFDNTDDYDEMVLVRHIPVRSVCEHHMLPFVGVAHVGYLPGDHVVGLSKLARVVDFYARRPQTQERLTTEVAHHLDEHLAPQGVGVVVAAEHTCMTLRGAMAGGTHTVTSTLLGRMREDPATRAEFLALTRSTREDR